MISFLPSILGLVLSADEESCFSTLAGPALLGGLLYPAGWTTSSD